MAALEREQLVAVELQDKLVQQAQEQEDRVGGLEAQLSQLAQAVGDGERLRTQELQAKHKLQHRLAQLQQENVMLLEAASAHAATAGSKEEQSQGRR